MTAEPGTIEGVSIRDLDVRADDRGTLVECFRQSWNRAVRPVQWNLVRSRPGTLRGFHVHARHSDYLLLVEGRMLLGLHDIRTDSPTHGITALLELEADAPRALTLPPGVAHGFLLPEESIHLYAVTEYWNPEDELGCRWNDPEVGIDWPVATPLLSERDRQAGSFAEMVREYEAKRAILGSRTPESPDGP